MPAESMPAAEWPQSARRAESSASSYIDRLERKMWSLTKQLEAKEGQASKLKTEPDAAWVEIDRLKRRLEGHGDEPDGRPERPLNNSRVVRVDHKYRRITVSVDKFLSEAEREYQVYKLRCAQRQAGSSSTGS